jgi:hypothetical protein
MVAVGIESILKQRIGACYTSIGHKTYELVKLNQSYPKYSYYLKKMWIYF